MQKLVSLALAALPLTALSATQLIPTVDGTSWRYEMTQEAGEQFTFSDLKAGPDGKVHLLAIYRLSGTEEVEGKRFLKFEMHRNGVVSNVDLITVDEHGIFCAARIDQYGELTKLDPPQTMMAAPLKRGATWDFSGKVADADVHQNYEVAAEEDVVVPAGRFRAFHIHGEQTAPTRMTMDRWFVNGVGIVKDITEMRGPEGDLLRRISLELLENPKVAQRPDVKPAQAVKILSASLGQAPIGEAASEFKVDTPKIYARWRGHALAGRAKIRVVWIAESIGDLAPPNYTIDEATATANSPDAHGTFTLSKPDEGWAPGNYRVEFYVDADLIETIKIRILK